MQSHGVIYVADPIMSLDLSEMLTSVLHPTAIILPQSIEEAGVAALNAAYIVTDKAGSLALASVQPGRAVPHLYVGATDDFLYLTETYFCLEKPFTNTTVFDALQTLGLTA